MYTDLVREAAEWRDLYYESVDAAADNLALLREATAELTEARQTIEALSGYNQALKQDLDEKPPPDADRVANLLEEVEASFDAFAGFIDDGTPPAIWRPPLVRRIVARAIAWSME